MPAGAKWAAGIYGFIHLGALAVVFVGGGAPGIGYVVVWVAFLAMVAISISESSTPNPVTATTS